MRECDNKEGVCVCVRERCRVRGRGEREWGGREREGWFERERERLLRQTTRQHVFSSRSFPLSESVQGKGCETYVPKKGLGPRKDSEYLR